MNPPHAPQPELSAVTLLHGPHRWRLRWSADAEHALLASLVEYAERPDAPLSWADAAAIASRLGRGPGVPQSAPAPMNTLDADPGLKPTPAPSDRPGRRSNTPS